MLNRMEFDNAVEILNGTSPLMAVAATYYQVVADYEEQNLDPFAMDRVEAYELTVLELDPVADRLSEPILYGFNEFVQEAVEILIGGGLLMATDDVWTLHNPGATQPFWENPDFGASGPAEFLDAVRAVSNHRPESTTLDKINDLIGKMARPLR